MSEYLVNDAMCVLRSVEVVTRRYEPCEEREVFEGMGYDYKGGAECYSNSVHYFEYRYGAGMTSVMARSREEAERLYWERKA